MWYVGVDACKGGWFAVGIGPEGARAALCGTFASVWERFRPLTRLFLDMPVGLPEEGTRAADAEARRALPPHLASTIFNTPVRAAVYAPTKDVAKVVNRKLAGKSLSEQSLGLVKKIREVDTFLRAHPEVRDLVYESHPELCFGRLGGGFPSFAKKDWLGGFERFRIVRNFMPEVEFLLADARRAHLRTEVACDDMLDACILAVAARESERRPRFYPKGLDAPEADAEGLPMAIWHPSNRGEP